jgi:ABC-type uncharacterized transport system ATPase subunit
MAQGLWATPLSKSYGSIHALVEADIALRPGEVHAIVGENGAGKSTLAKILAGAVTADAGEIVVDGRQVEFRRRREAIAAGIGFVPQGLSLVGALTLVENDALGRGGFRLDAKRGRADLARAAARTGLSVALDVPTGRLSPAERQLGELLIALAQGARILLLDEPTSMLGPREIERLVRCLRALAADGIAIGLVTHRIAEVIDNADRLTVLRGGRIVHRGPTGGLTADGLARLMIGERSRTVHRGGGTRGGQIRLDARDLSAVEDGITVLDGVGFAVAAGEVLGVAGVAGASQPALAAVLAGLRRPERGTVTMDGVDITGAPAAAARRGLAYVPEERQSGLVADRSIAVNASLLRLGEPNFRRFGLRRPGAERRQGAAICASFDVRPSLPDLEVAGLSGGNQQKLLLGRELERDPAVVVAHSPTQGLDLAAAAAIRNRLIAAAAAGAAVVVISADLDEMADICDRLVVLSGGRIADEIDLTRAPLDISRLGSAMARGTALETSLYQQ